MTEHWMADLGEKIAGKKLRELVLPASHDAGTYGITPISSFSPDLAPWGLNVLRWVDLGVLDAEAIISLWARTQVMTVAQQLSAGYRVFDLRVAKSGDGLRICHGLYSVKLTEVLNAVRDFSNNNPREIIMLLLWQFVGMSAEDHTTLLKQLKTTFGDRLAPNSLGVNATVQDFWGGKNSEDTANGAGTPVMIVYENPPQADPILWNMSSTIVVNENYDPDHFHSAGDVINWDKGVVERNQNCDKFWDLPLILTLENNPKIFSYVSLERWTRETAVHPFTAFYEGQTRNLNIIAVDYVNLYSLAEWAIAKNAGWAWSDTRCIKGVPPVATSASSCACEYNERLYVFWKGAGADNQRIYRAAMTDVNGHDEWVGPNMVNLDRQDFKTVTDGSLAVAVFKGRLYVFWKGPGKKGRIYSAYMNEREEWLGLNMVNLDRKKDGSDDYVFQNFTDCSPAVAVFNERLYLLWKGAENGHIYSAYMNKDEQWIGPNMVNLDRQDFKTFTNGSPAVAAYNGLLYLIWKNAEHMYYAYHVEGMPLDKQWAGGWMVNPLGGTPSTDLSPALVAFDGKLYAAWKGSKHNSIWFTSGIPHNNPQDPELEWSPQTRFVVPGETMRSPALATYNGRLYNLRTGDPGGDENSIFYSYMPFGQSSASSFDERAAKLASSATA
jgi:hypothetical protein